MLPSFNPAADPALLDLKKAALSGERGRLYDQGVLAVIGYIERDGYYKPDRMAGLLCVLGTEQDVGQRMLTDDERAKARDFLAQRGWTFEQSVEYMSGVEFAEKILFYLRLHFLRKANSHQYGDA